MRVPKPDKPPYTPVTPTTDTLIGPARKPLVGISTSTSGLTVAPATQKKTLIGGAS
jgi:hypothetical protein